jgi:hypothetical protein
MADAINVVDDSSISLFAPRDSTSLWVSETGERRVAALDEVDFTPAKYEDAPEVLASSLDKDKPRDWAVNILVVKRNGQYNVYVDGREATPVNGVVRLRSHTGLWQQDDDPSALVFSPCMVSFLVEDGELHPQECSVDVCQRKFDLIGNPFVQNNSVGRAVLKPFRGHSQLVADSVLTPFPAVYPKQSTVSFYDLEKLRKKQIKATTGSALSYIPQLYGALKFYFDIGTTAVPTAAAATYLGFSSFAVFGSIALSYLGYANLSMFGGLADVEATPESMIKIFKDFITTQILAPEAPSAKKVTFTLAELCDALDGLTSLMSVTSEQLDMLAKTDNFEKQLLIFNWMLHDKDGDPPLSRGPNSPNPPDFSELANERGIGIELDINVSDNSVCSSLYRVLVSNKREDSYELASIAVGELQNIKRLEDSWAKLRRSMVRQVKLMRNSVSWAETLLTAGPGLGFFGLYRQLWKYIKAAAGFEIPKDEIAKSGLEMRKVLQYAIKQFDKKVTRWFFLASSPIQSRKEKLNKSLSTFRTPRVGPKSDIALWRRCFPHTNIGRLSILFPAIESIGENYSELEADGITVLQLPSTSKAIAAFNASSSAATKFFRRRLSTMQRARGTFNFYVDGYIASETFGKLSKRSVHFFSLMTCIPPNINAAIESDYGLSEKEKLGIEMILSRKKPISILQSLGLSDDATTFAALNTICAFLIDELVEYAQSPNKFNNELASVLGGPITSALGRADNASDLLLDMLKSNKFGFLLNEHALFSSVRTGRDVSTLLSTTKTYKLYEYEYELARSVCSYKERHFVPPPPLVSGWSPLMVDGIKKLASRIKVVAQQLKRTMSSPKSGHLEVVSKLPNEVLHSLFQTTNDGLTAHARGQAMLESLPLKEEWKTWLLCSFSSNYASNALVARDALPQPLGKGVARPPPIVYEPLVLRERLSQLILPTSVNSGDNVDDLIDSMLMLSMHSEKPVSLYVPYGYGDPLPTLKSPPASNPMFGSVPVWLADLKAANSILSDGFTLNSTQKSECYISLAWNKCTKENDGKLLYGDDRTALSPTPLLIRVSQEKDDSAMVISAVGTPPTYLEIEGAAKDTRTARRAVDNFHSSFAVSEIELLSESVSSLAWNTERILQCLLISRAYNNTSVVFNFPAMEGSPSPRVPDPSEYPYDIEMERVIVLSKASFLYDIIQGGFPEYEEAAVEFSIVEQRNIDGIAPLFVFGSATSDGILYEDLKGDAMVKDIVEGRELSDDELLVMAKNAEDYIANFIGNPKSEKTDEQRQGKIGPFWRYEKWGRPAAREPERRADLFATTERGKTLLQEIRGLAAELQASYNEFQLIEQEFLDEYKQRQEELAKINNMDNKAILFEVTSSLVIAQAMAINLLGDDAPQITSINGIRDTVADSFDFLQGVLRGELPSAIDAVVEKGHDAYKLSEACAIMLSLVYGS